ncbi:hypothetical protein AAG906_001741 [Vitis piasezkii]
MRWLIILIEFNIHYVTQKSIRGSIVANHLASLPVFDGRAINDNFLDEDIVVVTSLSDHTFANRVMREVHAGVCGPHMIGHMLACKIMRTECQIHGDLIHVPPSELHALTSPWPFSWVEAASYVRLTSSDTNGEIEAANKNIKRILWRMIKTSRDWLKKLPFPLWAYRTSFRTFTRATPYSLVYGMEAVLLVEIEMGSLRVALEQQILEADWAQA